MDELEALVVGIGGPQADDAEKVATALGELGFRVILACDCTYDELRAATDAFSRRLAKAAVAFFFFAGAAAHVDGGNYLLPSDCDGSADVKRHAIRVEDLVHSLAQRGRGLNVLVIDALAPAGGAAGLRRIEPPAAPGDGGSIIAYATAPGAQPSASQRDARLRYVPALLDHLAHGDVMPARELFAEVGLQLQDAAAASGGDGSKQAIPWVECTFGGPAARELPLAPSPDFVPSPAKPPPPGPAAPRAAERRGSKALVGSLTEAELRMFDWARLLVVVTSNEADVAKRGLREATRRVTHGGVVERGAAAAAGALPAVAQAMGQHAAKAAIQRRACLLLAELCAGKDATAHTLARSAVATGGLSATVRAIRSFTRNAHVVETACLAIAHMTHGGDPTRQHDAVECGALAALSRVMETHHSEPPILEHAFMAITAICVGSDAAAGARKKAAADAGALQEIVQAISGGAGGVDGRMLELACQALATLIVGSDASATARRQDAADGGALLGICRAMRNHPADARLQMHACYAITGVCAGSDDGGPARRQAAVECGFFKVAVRAMGMHWDDVGVQLEAMGALRMVCRDGGSGVEARRRAAAEAGVGPAVEAAQESHNLDDHVLQWGDRLLAVLPARDTVGGEGGQPVATSTRAAAARPAGSRAAAGQPARGGTGRPAPKPLRRPPDAATTADADTRGVDHADGSGPNDQQGPPPSRTEVVQRL